MADGYARYTNQPQCVIIHVDVGTQGLGAAVHNASCGRAPVLVFAGLSPYTIEGEYRGSRTDYIHWIQDVPDQKQIVAQYCRYTGEIKRGKNVKVSCMFLRYLLYVVRHFCQSLESIASYRRSMSLLFASRNTTCFFVPAIRARIHGTHS